MLVLVLVLVLVLLSGTSACATGKVIFKVGCRGEWRPGSEVCATFGSTRGLTVLDSIPPFESITHSDRQAPISSAAPFFKTQGTSSNRQLSSCNISCRSLFLNPKLALVQHSARIPCLTECKVPIAFKPLRQLVESTCLQVMRSGRFPPANHAS